MAGNTKKTETNEAVEKTVAKKPEKTSDKVHIMLFKDNGKYKDDLKVGLNGRIWVIERGVPVEVPKAVAEIISHSQSQDIMTANMINQMESEYTSKASQLN